MFAIIKKFFLIMNTILLPLLFIMEEKKILATQNTHLIDALMNLATLIIINHTNAKRIDTHLSTYTTKIKNIFNSEHVDLSQNKNSFFLAAAYGNSDIIELFLKAGFDANTRYSKLNNTPLLIATMYRNVETVKTLITHKADPIMTNKADISPCDYLMLFLHNQTKQLCPNCTDNDAIKIIFDIAQARYKNPLQQCNNIIHHAALSYSSPSENIQKEETPQDTE